MRLHGTLSGPATKVLLQRAYSLFGDPRYQRLATLSVSHLYNLRHLGRLPVHSASLDQDPWPLRPHRGAPRPRA